MKVLLACILAFTAVSALKFGKEIKYKFTGMDASAKSKIVSALSAVSSKTCLTFTEDNTASVPYINFKSGQGCYAHLGAQRRGNTVVLSKYCLHRQIIQKEVMHSLGFGQEIGRSDRDQFVTINLNNIPSHSRHNFRISNVAMNKVTDYDYLSVLHYGKYAFSNNRKPTIVTKDASFQDKIGKGTGLSAMDVEKINKNFC